MKKHRQVSKRSVRRTVLFGVIFSSVMLIVASLCASLILGGSKDAIGSISIAALICFMVSAAISGFAIAKYKGEGGFTASLIASVIFSAAVIAIALIAGDGGIKGAVPMNCLCYVLVAAFTAYLGARRKRRRR